MTITRSLLFLVCAASRLAAQGSHNSAPLAFDHLWIAVSRDAPERAALERAGFVISPDVNHHDGQGTASITVEFDNAFLELIWVDPGVRVSPGLERVAQKFSLRSAWRTSHWSPFGVGLRRAGGGAAEPLPVPSYAVTGAWMPAGSSIEMLTPRDDSVSPSFFVSPAALTDTAAQAARGARFHHRNGVHRVTAVRLLTPAGYRPISALEYLENTGVLQTATADQWTIEMTFDGGVRHIQQDLRPALPLIVRR